MQADLQGKQQTRERIFRLLRTEPALTRREIASALELSMPTTLQNVTELLESGILAPYGPAESQGGRKAQRLCLNGNAGWVLGVHIAVRHTDFIAADLCGNTCRAETVPLAFQDTPEWYARFAECLSEFIRQNTETLLGAGVSFPGITDNTEILRSHIFGLSHMGLERFRRCIPCPAVFENDANCACLAERRPGRGSYFYLSLNETVGGALILNGRLIAGDTFQAGEVGHMILVPGGDACYCGKQGCADTYLSPNALTGGTGSAEAFFERLRQGDPDAGNRWETYSDHLAVLLTNLRMLLNVDFIIGGTIGGLLADELRTLLVKAAQYDRFARDIDYIFPCACRERACAAGAAGLALDRFGSRILEKKKRGCV